MAYFDTLEKANTATNNNNKKLVNILLQNGWIAAKNTTLPKNALEIFSYQYNVEYCDKNECKNVNNHGTLHTE